MEVDFAVSVDVAFFDYLGPLKFILLLVLLTEFRFRYSLDIVDGQGAFVVAVESDECFLQFFEFFLGDAEPRDQRQHDLLKLI